MWPWSTLKTRASRRRKQKTAKNIPVLSSSDQTVRSQTVAPINYGFGNSTIELFARWSIQAILPVLITCNRVKSVALLYKFMMYLRQALARRNQEKPSRKRHGWNVFPVLRIECVERNATERHRASMLFPADENYCGDNNVNVDGDFNTTTMECRRV